MNDVAWRPAARRLGRLVFGDRVGLVIWLGLLVATTLTWRIGFFITDTYGVANALVNVAGGSLAVTEVPYAPSILASQPGLHESGGRLYGRNYGQVFLAVPFVWVLQAVTTVAPLHVVLAAGWSLAILAFSDQFAAVVDRDGVRVVGSVVALVAFGVNALGTLRIDPDLLHLVALQLSTLVAAAFGGVCFYRLVGVFHHERVAVAAGVAVVTVLPIGFWTAIPKRHVLVTTLVLAGLYCFARSRAATGRRSLVAHAGAYVFVSLVAWTHAFEGFFALAALTTVDALTGGVRDRKHLAAVASGLVVGLTPMLLTNALISGNPLEPPRMLPSQGSAGIELAPTGEVQAPEGSGSGNGGGGGGGGAGDASGTDGAGDGSGSGGDGGGSGGDGSGSGGDRPGGSPLAVLAPLLGPARGTLDRIDVVIEFVERYVTDGLAVLSDPERLWHIFVRSGRIDGVQYGVNHDETIDLTFLESAPILAGVIAVPLVLASEVKARFGRDRSVPLPWDFSPRHQTDLLVAVMATILTVVYLSRLPLFSQITVRYILYTMPLWLYGVVRLPPVREAIRSSPWELAAKYAFTVVAGVALLSATLAGLDVAIGEAMQFHALVNLGAGTVFVGLVVARWGRPERVSTDWLVTAVAVAAGLSTVFLFLAGLEYFQYGPFALEIARTISTAIPIF